MIDVLASSRCVQRDIKKLLKGWLGPFSFTGGFLARLNEVINRVEQVIYSRWESSRVIVSSTQGKQRVWK